MANINVRLKNAVGDILYPQTKWGNIIDKPSVFVAQNASTSAGTIQTETASSQESSNCYRTYIPRTGGHTQIALEYQSGQFLVLQTDGNWVKKDIDELSMNGSVSTLTIASHSHFIKGSFK